MRMDGMKNSNQENYLMQNYREVRPLRWMKMPRVLPIGGLLVGVLLAGMLALTPTSAQAATNGWWPHFMGGGSGFLGFWLTGEVTEVTEDSVTLQLPNHHRTRGMMRYVSLNVTLDVDVNSVLLDGDLGSLALTTLAEGDEVVVVPRLVWGNLVARLLYAGDPKDLAEASYRGKLLIEDGDVLTLQHGRSDTLTVQVDDETVWYDDGQMTRPAELAEDITLRVLGIETENEAGDDIIRAVLITPGK